MWGLLVGVNAQCFGCFECGCFGWQSLDGPDYCLPAFARSIRGGLTRRFLKGEGLSCAIAIANADVLLLGIGIEFDLKVFSPIHTAGNGSVPQKDRLVLTEGSRQDPFLEVNRQPQTVFD
jgi:hypothetical protein